MDLDISVGVSRRGHYHEVQSTILSGYKNTKPKGLPTTQCDSAAEQLNSRLEDLGPPIDGEGQVPDDREIDRRFIREHHDSDSDFQ